MRRCTSWLQTVVAVATQRQPNGCLCPIRPTHTLKAMMPRLAVRFVPVAVALALALAAGCSSGDDANSPEPSPTTQTEGSPPAGSPSVSSSPELPTGAMNQPFRNGAFEIVVSRVQAGLAVLPVDTKDLQPDKAENGQFILMYLSSKNAGNQEATMSYTSSTLVDDQTSATRRPMPATTTLAAKAWTRPSSQAPPRRVT